MDLRHVMVLCGIDKIYSPILGTNKAQIHITFYWIVDK